jgi:hypothetical protein
MEPLYWTRVGDDFILKHKGRRVGRVFRDAKYPTMWRSRRGDGKLSDLGNLSWAKNAVLLATERELGVEAPAIRPPKPQQKRTFSEGKSSPVRLNAAEVLP